MCSVADRPNTSTASLAPGFTMSSAQSSGSVQSRVDAWFRANSIIAAPTIGVDGTTGFGTLGRNTLRGPFQQNWDTSIGKIFRIAEGKNFKFSADFFNVWNHPIFASPGSGNATFFNTGSFGQITSTKGTPRLIQFSGRFSF